MGDGRGGGGGSDEMVTFQGVTKKGAWQVFQDQGVEFQKGGKNILRRREGRF